MNIHFVRPVIAGAVLLLAAVGCSGPNPEPVVQDEIVLEAVSTGGVADIQVIGLDKKPMVLDDVATPWKRTFHSHEYEAVALVVESPDKSTNTRVACKVTVNGLVKADDSDYLSLAVCGFGWQAKNPIPIPGIGEE